MGAPKIEEIAAHLAEWDFLEKLPAEINGFKKVAGTGVSGQILNIAAYVNEKDHRRLDLTYTSETFDYVPVKTIGLHSFRDERYFCRDQQQFGENILKHLEEILADISIDKKMSFSYAANGVNFQKWDYWRQLPKRIGDFELCITPDNPLNYINGSCIFLDYSDFKHNSSLYFLFNSFRIEVFGEMIQRNMPVTINTYTVPQEDEAGNRSLDVDGKVVAKDMMPLFTELLKANLEKDLARLARAEFVTL